MHSISSSDDTVQHLIDRANHDACDPASRLIDLLFDPRDKDVVDFQGALAGIDGATFSETPIFPKTCPVLFFFARGVQALPKEERRLARENRLTRDGR